MELIVCLNTYRDVFLDQHFIYPLLNTIYIYEYTNIWIITELNPFLRNGINKRKGNHQNSVSRIILQSFFFHKFNIELKLLNSPKHFWSFASGSSHLFILIPSKQIYSLLRHSASLWSWQAGILWSAGDTGRMSRVLHKATPDASSGSF